MFHSEHSLHTKYERLNEFLPLAHGLIRNMGPWCFAAAAAAAAAAAGFVLGV